MLYKQSFSFLAHLYLQSSGKRSPSFKERYSYKRALELLETFTAT